MAIQWRIRALIAQRFQIYRLTEIQEKIIDRTGVKISLQQLSEIVNKRPKSLKLSTMEIICTALDCKLSDFCEVMPSQSIAKKRKKIRKLSPSNVPISKRNIREFPDPNDYQS